jgi:hypothetical protein
MHFTVRFLLRQLTHEHTYQNQSPVLRGFDEKISGYFPLKDVISNTQYMYEGSNSYVVRRGTWPLFIRSGRKSCVILFYATG